MTPAKRRPATPASQGPARTAPDVPIVAANGPAATDGAQLLGPEGEPISEETLTADARRDPAPPTETRPVDAEVAPAKQAPGRPISLYPLPVWPD